jgi:hypothetical protein
VIGQSVHLRRHTQGEVRRVSKFELMRLAAGIAAIGLGVALLIWDHGAEPERYPTNERRNSALVVIAVGVGNVILAFL